MSKFGAWISGKGIVMLDRNKKVDQDKLDEAQRDKVETLKRLRARVVGYSASRNVFRVIDDEIQKADPNYKPNYSARARKAVVVERNELVQKLRTDLATANSLLDKAKVLLEEFSPFTDEHDGNFFYEDGSEHLGDEVLDMLKEIELHRGGE